MADFSSGVSGYIKGSVIVTVSFPVDIKGNASVCCAQCSFFDRYNRKCHLNDKMTAYPEKYIGQYCPLDFEDDEEGNENGQP